MKIVHTSIRPFMVGNSPEHEPNEYYRPWLEANVGEQGKDWEWDMHSVRENTLEIRFITAESATLFELTYGDTDRHKLASK